MRSHRLFSKTRWRLTLFYAGVIGVVVFLTQLAMHSSLWVVQTQGFDYSIEQLAGTIHDYLVAQLEQPGVVQAETQNVLTGADVNHINLLGIVYTPAAGKVTVYLKQTHASAIVDVEDTGIGIAPCRPCSNKSFNSWFISDSLKT